MAKAGDKKRIQDNKRHLDNLASYIAYSNVLYVIVRLARRRATATLLHYVVGLGVTNLVYLATYTLIKKALAPHYSPTGEIIYSGADLKTGGIVSYYHDVLYLTLFSQTAGSFTDKAWWVHALIPGYAVGKIVSGVIIPWFTAPKAQADEQETEIDRKRREKKERQAARTEKFTRN